MKTMNTLIGFGAQLAETQSEEGFRRSIESVADFIGAGFYNVMVFNSNEKGSCGEGPHNLPASCINVPRLEAQKRDPTAQHCRINASPIIWDQSTYRHARCEDLWEDSAAQGMPRGACMALHIGKSRHFFLGFMWTRKKPFSEAEKIKAALTLQTISVFAEPTAFRLWHPAMQPQPIELEQPLSHRERECLYWVSRGMTDDLIGRLLKISARTVRKHVDNSVLKLSAANRTEAAVTATRLGLWVHGGVGS